MPIYEYGCVECNQIVEEWQSDFEEHDIPCPVCGGKTKRLISNTSFVLKGSGWYVTDYAGKNASAAKKEEPANGQAKASGNGEAKASSNGDSKAAKPAKSGKSESKPATGASKSESKPAAKSA